MNSFTNRPISCPRVAIGGVNAIYISQRSKFGRFWISEETTTPHQYGIITGHTGTQNVWFSSSLIKRKTATLSSQQTEVNSRAYDVTLSFIIGLWDTESRDYTEQLYQSRDMLFIVEDNNGDYWLVGEQNGCDVTYASRTNDSTGNNEVVITATCKQRSPLRQVTDTYVQAFVINTAPCLCEQSLEDYCLILFDELCGYSFACAPQPSAYVPCKSETGTLSISVVDPITLPLEVDPAGTGRGLAKLSINNTECCPSPYSASLVSTPAGVDLVRVDNNGTDISVEVIAKNNPGVDTDVNVNIEVSACGQLFPYSLPVRLLAEAFQFNNALDFDGINDYVIVPGANFEFGIDPDFSVSFWLNMNALSGAQRIINNWTAITGSTRGGFRIAVSGTGAITAETGAHPQTGSSIMTQVGSGTLMSVGVWRHVVVNFVGPTASNWSLYVDGVLQDVGITNRTQSYILGLNDLYIGTIASNPGLEVLNAKADETTVYNRALAPAEVAHLYNSGNGNPPTIAMQSNLVARWKFDEEVSPAPGTNTASDSSGNGNDGALINFGTRTQTGDPAPAWVPHL